jgi:tRNA dimethylallyltransferase
MTRCQLPSDAGDKKIRVPVLLGPTAVGKTRFAMDIAAEQGCEIVSCDSRQIYKYMDIGTAKPSPEELATVKHWLVDIVPPSEGYSAFRYAQDAARIIRERAAAGMAIIVCGGSGLYFQALSHGLGPQVAADPGIRRHYEDLAAQQGREAVWERLKKVDPVAARSSHAGNLTRNIRALEVFETMGVPLSELKKNAAPPQDIEFSVIVLGLSRASLYERINKRVDAMIKQGLWDEFRSLRNRGYDRSAPGLRCVGYRELLEVEENAIDLQTAIERIKQNTRHFAKRQLTWLRHQVAGTPVDMAAENAQVDAARCVSAFLRRR